MKTNRRAIFTLIGSAICVLASGPASAGSAIARLTVDGALDTTFSGDGKDSSTIDGRCNSVRALPFSGGKTLTGGEFTAADGSNLGIVGQYNNDGTGDAGFGYLGVIPVDFSTATNESVFVVNIQSDLKIIAAGWASFPGTSPTFVLPVIWRFNQNGSLDTSFGSGGVATAFASFESGMRLYDMYITDDKIVISGEARVGNEVRVAVARFTRDGDLDSTFSGDGMQTASFGTHFASAHGAASDGGKIIVSGYVEGLSNTSLGLMRFTSSGSLDNTFSGDGKATIDYSGTIREAGSDIACWPNQGCFIVGSFDNFSSTNKFVVARIQSDGTLEPTFGKRTVTFPGTTDSIGSGRVVITNDLKVVVSGYANSSSTGLGELAVARLTFTGSLDNTFSGDGRVTIGFPGFDLTNNRVAGLGFDHPTGKAIPCGGSF